MSSRGHDFDDFAATANATSGYAGARRQKSMAFFQKNGRRREFSLASP
jgi:hypothetical protein